MEAIKQRVQSLGGGLLSEDFSVVLESKQELHAILHCSDDNNNDDVVQQSSYLTIAALVAQVCDAPHTLWVVLCDALTERFASLTTSSSTLSSQVTWNAWRSVVTTQKGSTTTSTLADDVFHFLCDALTHDDTAVGVAASKAVRAAIASVAPEQVAPLLQPWLSPSPHLLRLFDDSALSSSKVTSHVDATCRALRLVPYTSAAGGGAGGTTDGNLLDAYLLNTLMVGSIHEGDVLLLMNAMYAAGSILRHPPTTSTSTSSQQEEQQEGAQQPQMLVLSMMTLAIMDDDEAHAATNNTSIDPAIHVALSNVAPMLPMLKSFAIRAMTILCDRSSHGASLAKQFQWPAQLARIVFRASEDSSIALDALSSLCTTGDGLEAVLTSTKLLVAVQPQVAVSVASEETATSAAVEVTLSDRYVELSTAAAQRGSSESRIAWLTFAAAVVRGPPLHASSLLTTSLQPAAFRTLWNLRHSSDEGTRVALWHLVLAALHSRHDGTRVAVAPSCASHILSLDREDSMEVRRMMTDAAQACLQEPSVSLLYPRLRQAIKNGLMVVGNAATTASGTTI